MSCIVSLGGKFGGNRLGADLFAVGTVKIQGLLRDEVNHSLEIGPVTDGNLHHHGVAAELFSQLLGYAMRIGARAVHLVDQCQPRYAVSLHLAIDR